VKIERLMRRSVVTIQRGQSVDRAQTLMAQHGIRHLPVLDGAQLVGVIAECDVRGLMVRQSHGARSGAGRAWFLLPGVTVDEAMTPDPQTITPDADIDEAARILTSRKIGCLPVVDRGRVVGIVTETDLLGVVSDIMGLLTASSCIDIALGRDPRALERTSQIIRRHHGKIISVGMSPGRGKLPRVHHFRLQNCDVAPIAASLRRAGFRVLEDRGVR
jgi:acetoin utilization protein AcuB